MAIVNGREVTEEELAEMVEHRLARLQENADKEIKDARLFSASIDDNGLGHIEVVH